MTFLESLYQRIEQRTERFVSTPNWKLKSVLLGIGVMLLSFFNNFSPLYSFKDFYKATIKERKEYHIYQTVKDRSENLTGNFEYEPNIGLESRIFRMTMPVIAKVLHLKRVSLSLYAIQLVLGVLFLFLLLGFLEKLMNDRIEAFFAFIGIMGLYVGSSFFIDNASYFDFFSFFFLFLALKFYKNPLLIFIFIQLAMWNDERAFVASGLVLMWYWWYPQYLSGEIIKVKITIPMFIIMTSWVLFLGTRWYLENKAGMIVTYLPESEYMTKLPASFNSLGFRVLWPFEAWWVLFILAGYLLWKKKEYLPLAGIGIASLTSIFSAMIVYDSTRSASFGYLTIFFALLIAKKHLSQKELRVILLLIAILCFLHPLATKTHGIGFFLM
jgi:hypothetical protein